MVVKREALFNELFTNFLSTKKDVKAIIVSDKDGLVIAGKKQLDIDLEILSVLTSIVNPILERIRNEFAFKDFGSGSFDTDEYRLLFISVDELTTLSFVVDEMGSTEQLSPYGYFLAEKTAQILSAKEDDLIQLHIPNFEYDSKSAESSKLIKNQIYQMRLDSGGKYHFKFVIIGDHEVGKTSILRRFVEGKFTKDYRATIGINMFSHRFPLFGNEIIFSLWDIGAQKYFKRFRKTYYLGSQAAFIVFDLTNKESYDNVNGWYEELVNFINYEDLPIVIIGNKSDLVDQRVIEYQDGIKLATELSTKGITRISYMETSALTGENIEDAFILISFNYVQKIKDKEEGHLLKDILNEINSILESKNSLSLCFITESPFWSPALQILSEIRDLGEISKVKDENNEKIYKFSKGLTLRNYLYDNVDVSNSDGVFLIFDAREKDCIDPTWREIVIKIINDIEENKVIMIGIRVSEGVDWSQLMEGFDINEYLEKKMVSLLFFKIGVEYRLEIYDQLKVMLNSIKFIQD